MLKRRVHEARKPKTGLQVGQTITYRELDESKTTTWRLVDGPTDVDKRELSIETPIAKSLIGHELNEVVDLALPKRRVRVEIVEIER